MTERKMIVFYESTNMDSERENELLEVIHKFICPSPEDPTTDCPLYGATWQDVVEEES